MHKYQLAQKKKNVFCYDHILKTTDSAYMQKNRNANKKITLHHVHVFLSRPNQQLSTW